MHAVPNDILDLDELGDVRSNCNGGSQCVGLMGTGAGGVLYNGSVFIRSIGGYYHHGERELNPPFNLISYLDWTTKQIKWSSRTLPNGRMK